MKRTFFFLVALAFTTITFAQDVIVKKDGSTILAKVLRITETEVEYKNFDNQDGPTRIISISNLQSINYQNGQKETFAATNVAKTDIVTRETATQFSNDQELLSVYNTTYKQPNMAKKAKRLKTIGWVVGGTLVATGIMVTILGIDEGHHYQGEYDTSFLGGLSMAVAGATTWAGCYFSAKNIEKRAKLSVQASPVFQQEFNVGKNDRLLVGVDVLNDNTIKNQTLGMGIRYNF